MAEIYKFEKFNKEQLEAFTADEFKQFVISQKSNTKIAGLVKKYLQLDSEIEAGIHRNSLKVNNGLISQYSAEENTRMYFQLGMELADIRRKIIEKLN